MNKLKSKVSVRKHLLYDYFKRRQIIKLANWEYLRNENFFFDSVDYRGELF